MLESMGSYWSHISNQSTHLHSKIISDVVLYCTVTALVKSKSGGVISAQPEVLFSLGMDQATQILVLL